MKIGNIQLMQHNKQCEIFSWKYKDPLTFPSLCIRILLLSSCSVMSNSLQPHELQPTRLLCPWDFLGKNTGASRHFLLQRIFPPQGLNPGLLHCRQILYQLGYGGIFGLKR